MNTNKETVEISQKFLLGDLIKVAMQEIKGMPFAWGALPEKDQQKVIERITDKFTAAVRQAVMHIAADGWPHLVADVDSVTFKDGIKCQLTVAKQSADRHELADATGTVVLIVLPNIQKHLEGDIPKATPDQPELI